MLRFASRELFTARVAAFHQGLNDTGFVVGRNEAARIHRGISGVAATWPLAARAQQPAGRVYRVGYLAIASRGQQLHLIKAFEEGLQSLGYRVGENVVIEYRSVNGVTEQLPAIAADLVRLGVDIIIASGGNPATVAVMKATTTIPIVMTSGVDPVSTGLVASLARPGGNVTGLAVDTGSEILGKRFELLKETVPNLSRLGILFNPDLALTRTRPDVDDGDRPNTRVDDYSGRSPWVGRA